MGFVSLKKKNVFISRFQEHISLSVEKPNQSNQNGQSEQRWMAEAPDENLREKKGNWGEEKFK